MSRDSFKESLPAAEKFKTVIFDELSGIKNPHAARTKLAIKLSRKVDYFWGLTGTPQPNGLLDLWSQIYVLDHGARLGTRFTGFRERYFAEGHRLPTGVVTEWIERPGAADSVKRSLEDICLSMDTVGRVDLPPVTVNEVEVPMSLRTRKLYRTLKEDLVVGLELLGGETHYAANSAVLTSRLSQLAAGFLYCEDDGTAGERRYDLVHTEKVDAVKEIVEGTGSPVLVFYRFRAEYEMLRKAFGDKAHSVDEEDVIERWNAGEIPVLLAHPASAGHGLNLQYGGHTIVWTTLPWSLEEKQQADARLARQGQTQPVVVHELMTPKSIDLLIKDALTFKTVRQEALLEHLESPL